MARIVSAIVGLLAATAAAAGPASLMPRLNSCSPPADLTWSAWDFSFNKSIILSTPAHQIDDGEIRFNISNPAFPGSSATTCSAFSTRPSDFFHGMDIYPCSSGTSEDDLRTTFSYDAPTGMLAVNQSWSCPKAHYLYQLSANLSQELNCNSSGYVNSNWTIGQIYSSNSTVCTAPMFTLTQ